MAHNGGKEVAHGCGDIRVGCCLWALQRRHDCCKESCGGGLKALGGDHFNDSCEDDAELLAVRLGAVAVACENLVGEGWAGELKVRWKRLWGRALIADPQSCLKRTQIHFCLCFLFSNWTQDYFACDGFKNKRWQRRAENT